MTALASSTSGLDAREPDSVSDESESAPGEDGALGAGCEVGVELRDGAADETRWRLFTDDAVDGGDRFVGAISPAQPLWLARTPTRGTERQN